MGIFDRVKEVITVDITEKISYGTRIRKLSAEITSNENTIKNLINLVGIRCVENHITETDSEYLDLFSEILKLRENNQNLSEEIEKLKEQQAEEERQRKQMREEMQLAKQKNIDDTVPETSPQESSKFCTQCGGINDLDAAFCVHCGNPFAVETTETKEKTDVL